MIKINNLKNCSFLFKKYLFFDFQKIKFFTTTTTSKILEEENLLNEKSTELVKSIIDEYKNDGRLFTLPWADQQVLLFFYKL
jgi:hypothetical protein